MGWLIGRTGCNENRDFRVTAWFNDDGDPLNLTEQLLNKDNITLVKLEEN